MSGGEIAALIAAAAFLLLVGVLAVPILKLRHTVDAATRAIDELTDRTSPVLTSLHTTVEGVNTTLGQVQVSLDGVNVQLDRLDVITNQVQRISSTVANLTTVVGAAASNPLVKVAAFGYGVRKAASRRRRADEESEVRDRVKQERKAGKRKGES